MGSASMSAPFCGAPLAEQVLEVELARQPLSGALHSVFARLQMLTSALVGERGFDALLARAVHMSRATCVWLPKGELDVEARSVAAALTDRSGELGADEVKKCSIAILGHLFDLLCSFIGEDLTRRLIGRAWAAVPGGSHD